jgi:hypothetical protein
MFVLLFVGVFALTYATGTQKGPRLCARTSRYSVVAAHLSQLPVPTLSRANAWSPSGARIAARLLPPVVAVSSTGYSPLLPLVNRDFRRSCSDPKDLLSEPGPMTVRRGWPSPKGTRGPAGRRSKPLQPHAGQRRHGYAPSLAAAARRLAHYRRASADAHAPRRATGRGTRDRRARPFKALFELLLPRVHRPSERER